MTRTAGKLGRAILHDGGHYTTTTKCHHRRAVVTLQDPRDPGGCRRTAANLARRGTTCDIVRFHHQPARSTSLPPRILHRNIPTGHIRLFFFVFRWRRLFGCQRSEHYNVLERPSSRRGGNDDDDNLRLAPTRWIWLQIHRCGSGLESDATDMVADPPQWI